MPSRTPTARMLTASVTGLYLGQALNWSLGFGSRLVLARLLSPADFGAFALGMFLVAAARTVQDLGLTNPLIRDDTIPAGHVLRVQLLAGIGLIGLLTAGRHLTGALHPALPSLLPLLALTLIPDAVSATGSALLARRVTLHRTVAPDALGLLVAALVAIGGAWYGMGIWGLVAGQLAGSIARAVWLWARTHEGLALDTASLWSSPGPLLRQGRYFLLLGVTGLLLLDLDKLILGVFSSATEVGYYTMAFGLVYLPARLIETPLRQVAYPTFARLTGDPARTREAYAMLTLASLTVEIPLAILFALQAGPILRWLYGPQWAPAAPLVTWMCALTLVDPFSKFGGTLLQARGREDLQYWITLPYTLFFVTAAWLLTSRFGVGGLILANYLQIGGWYISLYILGELDHQRDIVLRTVSLYGICGMALAAALQSGIHRMAPAAAGLFVCLLAAMLMATVGRPALAQVLALLRDARIRRPA